MNQASLDLSGWYTPQSTKDGNTLRDEGISLVMDNAGQWKDDALCELEKIWVERRHEGNEFTFEMLKFPVVKAIGEPRGSKNIWGALAKKMRSMGWIQDTGKTCTAQTAARHGSLSRVYVWSEGAEK